MPSRAGPGWDPGPAGPGFIRVRPSGTGLSGAGLLGGGLSGGGLSGGGAPVAPPVPRPAADAEGGPTRSPALVG